MSYKTFTLQLNLIDIQRILELLELKKESNYRNEEDSKIYEKIWPQFRGDAVDDGNEPIAAFSEGCQAARDNLDRNRNPYPPGSYRGMRWDDGWCFNRR